MLNNYVLIPSREMLEQSLAELQVTVDELERRSEGIDEECKSLMRNIYLTPPISLAVLVL